MTGATTVVAGVIRRSDVALEGETLGEKASRVMVADPRRIDE